MRRRPSKLKKNFLDRAVEFVSPVRGARRMRARFALDVASRYDGASKSRRALSEWNPLGGSPDADLLFDLESLRDRSRDLVRNNPLAAGAIKTKLTNVIGSGLRLRSHIDFEAIGMSEEQADAWERQAEREWRLFWDSKEVDAARTCNGHAIVRQVYQQVLENGDVVVLLPRVKRTGVPYELKLQVVEGDRLCNPESGLDSETLSGGVEKDKFGAPVYYHISRNHPGDFMNAAANKWDKIRAFGEKTGLRNVIHLFKQSRPGQSRGVPDLAPVIETIKQIGRYTDAEVMAAVISGYFTVFIESDSGSAEFDYTNMTGETGGKASDDDIKLGNGLVVGLAPGDKVHDTNPGRPNTAFDPFVQAVLRQVGVALEIPFELLVKHFTASYSAARAALNEFWKYVVAERRWLYDDFLILVYEIWIWEAVAAGRINAPGFFADPLVRQAYLGCDFVGPAKGQINEAVEVKAAVERINGGLSTRSLETAQLTGGDWERNHQQLAKENRKRKEDGLIDGKESSVRSQESK